MAVQPEGGVEARGSIIMGGREPFGRTPVEGSIMKRSMFALVASIACALTAGCSAGVTPPSDATDEGSLSGLRLELLVVDDAALAASAAQLQGEWNAQTGADFQVRPITAAALEAATTLTADALICPSHQLGILAERKRIAPLSKKTLTEHDKTWSEMFDLVRLHEASWGRQIYAVPLGSPVLTCYYRPDLLRRLGREPPKTWTEYQDLAALLGDRKRLGDAAPAPDKPWHGAVEPLGPGWAGQVLLARAASYAKHPDSYSTLFDIATMEPLIDGPPWIRALEELVAAARLGPAEAIAYDPDAARTAFWQGLCGLAISWPTSAAPLPAIAGKDVPCGFARLPSSPDVYSAAQKAWVPRGEEADSGVPLLGVAGRVGVVSSQSSNPDAAVRLLFWLAEKQGTGSRKAASAATTLFRRSDLESPEVWVEPRISDQAAGQYAAAVQKSLNSSQWLVSLRIPGRAEYMAVLDHAVQQAVRGEQPPHEALRRVASRWREITRRLGTDQQRQAYLHSLELE
jgi:multiple sugar transport system substrate-binding protein